MTGFDLIVFDCDGVVVDSEIIAAQYEAKLLSEAGYPIEPHQMAERFAGMTWKDILLAIEKEADIPLSASLLEKSEKALDQKLANGVKGIPGVRKAAMQIALPRCICSNSKPHRIEAMLKRTGTLDLFKDRFFSAAEVGEKRPKPAPDVFEYAAEKMGVDPARTVVVEDSAHGVEGARAANMRVIGFTGASHTYPSHADQLTEAGAETVVNRMEDLPPTVTALSSWSGVL
ncbi:MAG: HAD family phosphatase [Pseudomonadota bacterium]